MGTKISSPTISTLLAEINIVKIGTKQMTISAFNQLYEELCYDDNYNVLYPIWGKVNKDGGYVIFQKGGDLRKMKIPKNTIKPNYYYMFQSVIQDNKKSLQGIFQFKMQSIGSIINKTVDSKKEDLQYKNYQCINDIISFSKYGDLNKLRPDIDYAKTIISKDLLAEIDNYFLGEQANYESCSKMIITLNNSTQLFISI